MIAKAAPKRRSGRGSFSDLRQYLTVDDRGIKRDDLVASWSGNVASDATADIEMEQVAALGKTADPVYHVILSWRPGEEVAPQVARAAVDATLRSLGADDHQWFAAFHRDESDGRMHLHMGINKTHPITLKALDRYQDFAKLARACEFVEAEYGCKVDRRMDWRKKLPEVELGLTLYATRQYAERLLPVGLSFAPDGANTAEMDAARRAGYSWVALVAKDAAPAARTAAKRDGATWQDVHAALETYGVHFELAGSGVRVVGPEIGQHVKGSRVGISFKGLERKLGPYEPASYRVPSLANRLAEAKVILRRATSWTEIHRDLGAIGFAVERRSRGGRLSDLANGAQGVPLGRVGTSMPRLEERFGPYVETTAIDVRRDRERERRREGVTERIAAVAEHPEILVERISAHHSVWTQMEVEYELARVVGIDRKELVDEYAREVATVTEAVTGASYVLYQDDKQTWFTTNAIRDDERAMLDAFDGVAIRRRDLTIGPAATDLDAQQRRAYDHLNSGESDLRIVTGIGGAGKSRLLRSACAANATAGYRVHGVAVAGSAALVLGEEAGINARTVARFLIDVEQGHEKLGRRDVVVVDEVSTLGNDDAVRLADAVNKAGARLWLLGDVAQHETVARGPVLPELLERYEVEDLSVTRRAEEQWLRDVGTDLRAGRTARALDTLRDRGAIGEYETAGDAKASLVNRYATDVRNGESALLIATRTADVDDLNRLAREQLRDRLGSEQVYSTGFGTRAFAIGETVVTREPDSASRSVNGDVWKVAGHLIDGRLELLRERDGATVQWDVRNKPLIDYGYAVTSFRSQGRTVDGSYVLATQADAQRGLYVDVTRARKRVAIAYGRNDLHDFGRLLDVGARERAKFTIAGLERYLTETRRQKVEEKLTMAYTGPTTSGAPPRAVATGLIPRNVTPQNPGPRTPADLQRMKAVADASIAAEAARAEARSAEMVRNYERENRTTIKNVTPSVHARVGPPTPTAPPVPQPAMSCGQFRIRENAEIPNDWGRFTDARAFAEHLKTTPIGRVWRVELSETGDSVSLKNFFTSIKDSGHSISAKGKAERDIAAAVELAAEKGWKLIHVDGSEESRLSVAVAAGQRSIFVEGIAKEVLAKARAVTKALTPKSGWKP
jgi:hypothetical protein